MELFNDFIGEAQLREIYVSGSKFTWSKKQRYPTLVKLDRILCTVSWETHYPTCFAWAKARIGSDHNPLILDFGEQGATKPRYFFFEEKWLLIEGFLDLVKKKWQEINHSMYPQTYSLDRWHRGLQSLRQYLRGWNLKLIGQEKASKVVLAQRIEKIDRIAETRLLSFAEWEERIQAEKELDWIENMEEAHWKQRAGKNWVLQGDANTRFFHQFANGRRKNTITRLDSDSGEIRGQANLTAHIVDYYKQLFGRNQTCSIKLAANFWDKNLQVAEVDREDLIKDFSLEEIKEVIFGMKSNSAPGPNGFGAIFFKHF